MLGSHSDNTRPEPVTPATTRFREEAIPRSALVHGVVQTVKFEYYAPYSGSVAVASTFNNWNQTSHPLRKDSAGKWKLTLDLPLGRHEYRFVVDGQWMNDQRPVDSAPNPFGGYNNVLSLR